MKLIGKVPTYNTDEVHVYEDERDVVVKIVGERGGVHATARLSDWGASQLSSLVKRALMGVAS